MEHVESTCRSLGGVLIKQENLCLKEENLSFNKTGEPMSEGGEL
jgi:hypothetical protein